MGRKRHLKAKRTPEEQLAAERRSAAFKALKEYQKDGSLMTQPAEVIRVLMSESDRGAIILVAGILEDALGRLILARLPQSKARKDDLLGQGRVLNSFQAKLAIGRAMGILDDEMLGSFDIIRLLRNACSHSVRETTLQTPAIQDVFSLLFSSDQLRGYDADQHRLMLGFVMVFYVARMAGKSPEQAHAAVESIIAKMWETSGQKQAPSPGTQP